MIILRCILLLAAIAAAGGCTHFQEQLRSIEASTRRDVFQEVATDSPIPSGHVSVAIVASVKTHEPGMYLLEKSAHGTPEYRFLLNIDGEAMNIEGNLREEETVHRLGDPEGGRGIRYTFGRNLILRAGLHKVALALPTEAVIVKYEIHLREGSRNVLEVEPIYGNVPGKQRPGFYGNTSFLQGVKGLRVKLNGSTL